MMIHGALPAYMEYFSGRHKYLSLFTVSGRHGLLYIDDFDIKIDANALPTAGTEETSVKKQSVFRV